MSVGLSDYNKEFADAHFKKSAGAGRGNPYHDKKTGKFTSSGSGFAPKKTIEGDVHNFMDTLGLLENKPAKDIRSLSSDIAHALHDTKHDVGIESKIRDVLKYHKLTTNWDMNTIDDYAKQVTALVMPKYKKK